MADAYLLDLYDYLKQILGMHMHSPGSESSVTSMDEMVEGFSKQQCAYLMKNIKGLASTDSILWLEDPNPKEQTQLLRKYEYVYEHLIELLVSDEKMEEWKKLVEEGENELFRIQETAEDESDLDRYDSVAATVEMIQLRLSFVEVLNQVIGDTRETGRRGNTLPHPNRLRERIEVHESMAKLRNLLKKNERQNENAQNTPKTQKSPSLNGNVSDNPLYWLTKIKSKLSEINDETESPSHHQFQSPSSEVEVGKNPLSGILSLSSSSISTLQSPTVRSPQRTSDYPSPTFSSPSLPGISTSNPLLHAFSTPGEREREGEIERRGEREREKPGLNIQTGDGEKLEEMLMKNPEKMLEDQTVQKRLLDLVRKGDKFIKYGRFGKAHERYVWYESSSHRIYWGTIPSPHADIAHETLSTPQSLSLPTSRQTLPSKLPKVKVKWLEVRDVRSIYVGIRTSIMRRKRPKGQRGFPFSVETTHRTLDLETLEERKRAVWVTALQMLMRLKTKSL